MALIGTGLFNLYRQQATGTATGESPGTGDLSVAMAQADGTLEWQNGTAGLTAALESADATTTANLALAVINEGTGETYEYNADTRFDTASIVKVEILAVLLFQTQQTERELSTTERTLAAAMLKNSDNDAASRLWTAIGTERGFAAGAESLGLTATVAGTDGYWGTTRTTASDQARLLVTIADPEGPLDPSRASYLLGLMGAVQEDQSWGVSAAARSDERVELKNGWVTGSDLTWITNSVGRITGEDGAVSIAVLSDGHATMDDGVEAVEAAARAAREHLAW
jgi:beta-lactamase class A